MFMDAKETLVIANSALFLTVNSAAYIPLAFVNIVRFLIQGLGFTRQAVFARRAGNDGTRDCRGGNGASVRLYRRVRSQPGRVGGGGPGSSSLPTAGPCAGLQPRMNGMQKKTRTCRVMRMRTRWRPLGLQKRESIGKQPF